MPVLTVHLNIAIVPTGTVTVVVGEFRDAIEAVPLIKVHVPVPTKGVVAPIVKEGGAQSVWSNPAFAMADVRTTSSEAEQVPLLTVHLKVALVPGVIMTLVEGDVVDAIAAKPLTTVHKPD